MKWINSLQSKSSLMQLRRIFSLIRTDRLSRSCLSLLVICALANGALVPFAVALPKKSVGVNDRLRIPSTVQTTEKVTIYGPRRFDRTSGLPVTVSEQFVAPVGVLAPYTFHIQNGATDGTGRVSSGIIRLNGTNLFTQNDLGQFVPSLTRVVALQLLNTLEVNLTSSIGSFLTITITGTRPALLPAKLQSIGPTNATQGQTLSVTLHGQNTHWLTGQTRASFGPEVSVGGAATGELGVVTVTNATTAVAQVAVSSNAALSPRTVRVVTPNVPLGFPVSLIEESVSLVDAFTVVATSPPSPSATNVATIAGVAGASNFADGIGSQARFNNLAGLAIGPNDAIYVADAGNHRIRVVVEQPVPGGGSQWAVSTLAGDGVAAFADGPAGSAHFNNPQGIAVDSTGIVFVADSANNRIRRIGLDGSVTTLAGDGIPGSLDGPSAQARFNAPHGVAVDNLGNVYVADTGNAAVRLINSTGTVSTLAGDGTIGSSDSPGARFDGLAGVTVNGSSVYAYVADTGNHRIRRLDSTGTVFTIAGSTRGFADGSPSQARFAEPSGITTDAAGKILLTDAVNSLIRQIDPALAASGSSSAVTTVTGAGERGHLDGTGNIARFFTPRGIAATSSSALVVADTGNHVLRRVTLPPVISSFSPASARPGETITINGERFDGRGPNWNTVRFTRSSENGGGQTVATVTAATGVAITVIVPADAATGFVTVQTEGGTGVSPTPFEVLPRIPIITAFSPQTGPVGTVVTLAGQSLKADNGDPTVTFTGRGSTRLPALVTFASQTEVRAMVPNASVTGPIQLTNVWGTATTSGPFTVEASQDFQLTVAPTAVTTVQRGGANYVVYVTSQQSTFTQLARLTVAGLPSGVQATFAPSQITAGASSTLSLNLINATLSPGSYSLAISAAADIDGREIVRTAQVTLNVMARQTALFGRVLSTEDEPIVGATVSLDGHTAMTDAGGAFLLTGIAAGVDRPIMVDGRTASAPNRTYPVIIEPATLIAGEATALPYIFYLPAIDTQYEMDVVPGQNTIVTTPRVTGLSMTVPAGANLRNRDNSPVTRVSITPVPIDRTPAPLPPDASTAMVYTSQPGGAIADIAMPVVYPNLSGVDPGKRVELYAFDHDTVKWYVYGYGRVSTDGRLIEPEIDPVTGNPYGLRDFSWHFAISSPDGNLGPCDCPSSYTSSPVDLSTGVKVETATDISFGGSLGSLNLTRIYTSDLPQQLGPSHPFGRGTTHNYDVQISGFTGTSMAGRVLWPGQMAIRLPDTSGGYISRYARTEADGTVVFKTTATTEHLGDEVRRLTNGTREYRFASGEVMQFDSGGKLSALIDRNGNTTTLTYTGGKLTSITDAVGRSITLTYNPTGQIETATDPLNRVWTYAYEQSSGLAGSPLLTSVSDPLGNVTRYRYGSLANSNDNRLVSITDGRGNVIKQIAYYFNGQVYSQRFADNSEETYYYGFSGRRITSATVVDSLGRRETKRFNASGYVISTTDALGQTSRIERDITTNLPISTVGSCGCAEATRQFDERGNLSSDHQPPWPDGALGV